MTAQSTKDHQPSMEEVLKTIRGVIAGDAKSATFDDDNILELTSVIEEDGSVAQSEATNDTPRQEPVARGLEENLQEETHDILANIDQTIKQQQVTEAIETKSTSTSSLTVDDHHFSFSEMETKQSPVNPSLAPSSPHLSPTSSDENLLSSKAASESKQAFQSLLQAIPKTTVSTHAPRHHLSLEELIIETVRPELSRWLNEHLPALVTELVEKEIKKILPK